MDIHYRPLAATDGELLTNFLTREPWPFHAGTTTPERVRRKFENGDYDNEETRVFWMVTDTEVGLIRLMDLSHDDPTTDVRITSACRGQGLGTHAVQFIARYLFTELPRLNRVTGTTRPDNHAMRRVLINCGWAEFARHPRSWPDANGELHDTLCYAIARADWEATNGGLCKAAAGGAGIKDLMARMGARQRAGRTGLPAPGAGARGRGQSSPIASTHTSRPSAGARMMTTVSRVVSERNAACLRCRRSR